MLVYMRRSKELKHAINVNVQGLCLTTDDSEGNSEDVDYEPIILERTNVEGVAGSDDYLSLVQRTQHREKLREIKAKR
jgi:hypothetical protein